jgi:hypothetical protein
MSLLWSHTVPHAEPNLVSDASTNAGDEEDDELLDVGF